MLLSLMFFLIFLNVCIPCLTCDIIDDVVRMSNLSQDDYISGYEYITQCEH